MPAKGTKGTAHCDAVCCFSIIHCLQVPSDFSHTGVDKPFFMMYNTKSYKEAGLMTAIALIVIIIIGTVIRNGCASFCSAQTVPIHEMN